MYDIALIVSTFERPGHLKRCLRSIALQEGVDGRFEVIVVDDGSADETRTVVDDFARGANFPVTFTTHAHKGFHLARSRNEGAIASQSEYLLFIDGDCILPPDHIAVHLKHRRADVVQTGHAYRLDRGLSGNDALDGASAGELIRWIDRRERRRIALKIARARLYNMLDRPMRPRLCGINIGIWWESFERVNGFDEHFVGWGLEDLDLQRRLVSAGFRVKSILPYTQLFHLWHPPHPTFARNNVGTRNREYFAACDPQRIRCDKGVSERRTQLALSLCNGRLNGEVLRLNMPHVRTVAIRQDRSDPRISVIVPVYNRAATVRQTLASISAQTRPPSELVIVDDGSTDDLERTVRDWRHLAQPPFPVRFLRQENSGASAARNLGIRAAPDAKHYVFLDSDDAWPPNFLARTHRLLESHPNAVAATADRIMVDYNHGRRWRDDLRSLAENPAAWMVREGAGIGSATLFRADLVRRLGCFNEKISTGHDAHLFLRISLHGPWLHAPGAAVVFGLWAARSRGEQDHIRFEHANHQEIWARVYEDFLKSGGGESALNKSNCSTHMALRWRRAGRQCARLGRHRAARQHYRRSLEYRRHVKTGFYFAQSVVLDLCSRLTSQAGNQPA